MDIDLLSRILKELVTDHDMVGLPGIGTFVTEVVPASFSDKGYTINPPYRRLSFVQGRVEDKLLIDFYSESNEVDVEVAEAYITQFLHEMKQVLKERKIILLPGLGRLRATKENNFFFVPEEDLDIYPDGFALKPVSLKNIQREMEPVHIPVSFAEAVQSLMEKKKAEPQPEAWPERESLPQAETQPEPQLEQHELEADPEQVPEAQAEPEPKLRRELVPLDPEQVPYSGADIPLDPREINEAQFEPESEPEREPEPEAQPQPDQPEAERESEPQLEQQESVREAEQEPESEPEQEAQPQPEQESEPQLEQQESEREAEQEPEPQPEQPQSEREPEQEPEPQPESQSESEPEQEAQPRQRQRRRWWVVLLVVVALLAVALGVFVILAHAAPDFIDSILYTPEELRIINA